MKTLALLIAMTLCSCSTTELAQSQALLDAANAALQAYTEKPTK
jgi:hypothetical protein